MNKEKEIPLMGDPFEELVGGISQFQKGETIKKRIAALPIIATAGLDIEGFPPKEEAAKKYFPTFYRKVLFF